MKQLTNRAALKDKHLLFVAAYHVKAAVVLSINNILSIMKDRPDVYLIIIDSAAKDGIGDYLKTIKLDRVIIEHYDFNIGKPHGVNDFIARNIDESNLPKTAWSIDPDVLFDPLSFDLLLEAAENIEKLGMLGMRYADNGFNPEQGLYFPPKTIKGKNGKTYSLAVPFLCNVAGPLFVIPGALLKEPLNFVFYPIKFKTAYGPDDAALYDFLKRRGYRSGYLNGTLAKHLKTNDVYADEIKAFIANQQ